MVERKEDAGTPTSPISLDVCFVFVLPMAVAVYCASEPPPPSVVAVGLCLAAVDPEAAIVGGGAVG